MLVTNSGSNSVTPINIATGIAGTPVTVGTKPIGITVRGVAGSFPAADLQLSGSASASTVAAGTNISYTFTTTDLGPDASTGTTLTDTLPAGVAFVSATPSQGTCTQASGTITCNFSGLAIGGSASVTIVATPGGAAVPSLTNTGTVSGNETNAAPANATAALTTAVTASDDLAAR